MEKAAKWHMDENSNTMRDRRNGSRHDRNLQGNMKDRPHTQFIFEGGRRDGHVDYWWSSAVRFAWCCRHLLLSPTDERVRIYSPFSWLLLLSTPLYCWFRTAKHWLEDVSLMMYGPGCFLGARFAFVRCDCTLRVHTTVHSRWCTA